MNTSQDSRGMSRRDFIKAAGLTAAGIAAGSLTGVKAFGAPAPARALGANDRINIGFIGVGGMGMGHLHGFKGKESDFNIACVAVCDVWEKRKTRAQSVAGCPENMVFGDYRKLLEVKDIDAVVVSTPDHWHGQICIDAMQAGKHVYVEKPMTRTLDEAFKMRDAAVANKCVVQVGSQGCTDAKWHTAGRAVREGKIGTVLWAQGSYCRNNPRGEWNYPIDPDFTEDTCDWQMWLGPAPKIPFSPERYFRWRKFWDYGNGIIGDLWPHRLHPLMIAMDIMDFPKRVACVGANICNTDEGYGEKRDVADATMMICEFPSGAMIYLAGSTVNEQGLPDMIRGNKATMYFGGGKVEIRPERPWVDEIEQEDIPVVGPGEDHNEHRKNWLQSIRGLEKPNCGIDLGLRVQAIVSEAERSYRESVMANWSGRT